MDRAGGTTDRTARGSSEIAAPHFETPASRLMCINDAVREGSTLRRNGSARTIAVSWPRRLGAAGAFGPHRDP